MRVVCCCVAVCVTVPLFTSLSALLCVLTVHALNYVTLYILSCAGATVLQQGALPKPDDCMYFLEQGEAEVVISGAIDAAKGQVCVCCDECVCVSECVFAIEGGR